VFIIILWVIVLCRSSWNWSIY